ncbi:MAG: hypothetical protein RBU37_22615 [Myxococcota bacterium]|jgi:hypothetical protein|nr:hypothetical protein [Myxococcota bacterium]
MTSSRASKLFFILLTSFLLIAPPALAQSPLEGAAEDFDKDLELVGVDPISDIAGRTRVVRHRVSRHRSSYRYYRTRPSVVVVHTHHTRPRAARVQHSYSEPRESVISAGFRFLALDVQDTALVDELFEGDTYAGLGVYLRGRFASHFGLEFAVDVLGNTSVDDFDLVSVPVLGAFMAHLFPGNSVDLYGLIGGGISFNTVEYFPTSSSRAAREQYTQFLGQAGGGVEFNLGALQLVADARYLMMQARPERGDTTRTLAPLPLSSLEPDELTHAVQFTLGIGGHF